jgi:hypothetical protein
MTIQCKNIQPCFCQKSFSRSLFEQLLTSQVVKVERAFDVDHQPLFGQVEVNLVNAGLDLGLVLRVHLPKQCHYFAVKVQLIA